MQISVVLDFLTGLTLQQGRVSNSQTDGLEESPPGSLIHSCIFHLLYPFKP